MEVSQSERPLSQYHPDVLRQRLVDLGEDWADKDAAASLYEETKKSALAKLIVASQAKTMAEREAQALQSPEYGMHLEAMVEARKVANRAKVNYDAAKVWVEMARTAEATRRTEMRML